MVLIEIQFSLVSSQAVVIHERRSRENTLNSTMKRRRLSHDDDVYPMMMTSYPTSYPTCSAEPHPLQPPGSMAQQHQEKKSSAIPIGLVSVGAAALVAGAAALAATITVRQRRSADAEKLGLPHCHSRWQTHTDGVPRGWRPAAGVFKNETRLDLNNRSNRKKKKAP
jgi:hypothetical protein